MEQSSGVLRSGEVRRVRGARKNRNEGIQNPGNAVKVNSLAAYLHGIAAPSTAHPGSKRGFRHEHTPTRQEQRDLWYGHLAANNLLSMLPASQKCVPPAVKQRQPLEPVRPLAVADRLRSYGTLTEEARPDPTALSGLTPAQKRRTVQKRDHALSAARTRPEPVDVQPLAKTPPGTHQPQSHQMPRAMRKRIGALPRHQRAKAILSWQARNDRR